MDKKIIEVLSVLCIASANLKTGQAVDTGLAKFWANDYKAFHQIYGKTSDHDLFGDTLPLSVTHGMETKNIKTTKNDATRTIKQQTYETPPDNTAAGTQEDLFELSDNFSQQLAKRRRNKTSSKPKPVYGPVFVADETVIRNLKSANEATDQDTIDYLKQFENLGTQQAIDFPQEGLSGFKPYAGLVYRNPHKKPLPVFDSYKSIQDIIDAQDNYEDQVFERQKANHELAHKAYGQLPKIHFASVDKSPSKPQAKANKPGLRFVQDNDLSQNSNRGKCSSSRCRKPPSAHRLRKVRPRLRKIKKIVTLQN